MNDLFLRIVSQIMVHEPLHVGGFATLCRSHVLVVILYVCMCKCVTKIRIITVSNMDTLSFFLLLFSDYFLLRVSLSKSNLFFPFHYVCV
jgi:hypothetical protein